jgi:serine/threonine-protein kinase
MATWSSGYDYVTPKQKNGGARGNPMKRLMVTALVVCACVALVGCGKPVPDVKGKTVAQAGEVIVGAGFKVGQVTYDENATGIAGSIISQTSAAGDSIALVVAGKKPIPAPSLIDLDANRAKSAVTAAGLTLGAVTESYDASASAGTVAAQTPAPGADAAEGSPVDIVVSKGPQPVVVPSVVGKTKAVATSALVAAGFKVKTSNTSDKAKKGTVIAQKPLTGDAQPGTTVAITVSTGVEMVTVPDLYRIMYQVPGLDIFTGYSTIEAFINRRIVSKGLKVHVVAGDDTVSGPQQHPRKGSRVPRGTTITLGVLD